MTRHLLPAVDTATTSPNAPTGSMPVGRSQLTILGASVALALATFSSGANALALGPLKVISSLGEPLRAEIEIPQITADEADSMRIGMASPGAFSAAGVSYNPALADVRVNLERRGGRYVITLRGTRSLNDPFLDVLLEANWRSGRMVRDYTVLLDPPGSPKSQQAIAPVAPQVSTPRPLPQPSTTPYAGSSSTARSAPAAPAPVVRPAPAPAPVAPMEAPSSAGASDNGGQQVTVRPGDTAGAIARANKAPEISLDQMLVAMLRSNPDAFIGKNVNRVKAGAVLTMPSAREAAEVSPKEAKQMLVAQSRDFNQYRRNLAEAAPTSSVAEADRSAGGTLQANVQDRNAAAQSPDKLTITPGAAAGSKAAADESLVKGRQAAADAARVAELSRNLNELNKIQSAGGTGAAAPAGSPSAPTGTTGAPVAPAAVTPGIAVPVPGAAPAATTPSATTPAAAGSAAPGAAAPAASNTGTATGGAATPAVTAGTAGGSESATSAAGAAAPTPTPAPAPAAATPAKPKPKAPPPPPPPKSFFEELMDNPIILGAIGLIVLLLAFLGLRVFNRRKASSSESVFLESRIPKDSFFGSSGGESVDTKNQGAATSSMSYSPSQLDTGDVDPVAEADVYLAYGRDLQAEEILREALRINPDRTAIHLKLLEIHAKRRDLRAFEAQATEVRKLTGGTGSDWTRAVELGRDLDPGNPLYQSAPTPARAPAADMTPAVAAVAGAAAAGAAAVMSPAQAPAVAAEPPPPEFVPSVAPLDFDLELDSKPTPMPDTAPMPVSASLPPVAPKASPVAAPAFEIPASLDFGSLENDFDTAPAALEPSLRPRSRLADDEEHTQPATLRAGLPGDSGFVEFDVSTRSGLLGGNTSPAALEPLTGDDGSENPHAVKLTLARELHALGDAEGARSLVEEVAAETSGDLHAQAQQLLTQLR
ncbi:FimV/HubP family polar landmark protein [Variovorax dokdonensis]|uniref:FimV/HubP family polar landmark protein n=1 Tax=Variovorax dokdonensis TaxID=344883 RepID=A0ABT7N6L3_9BURK|nr:FimV/HubP family polar landmark protein [Variovorax dokdonensis]MDM0043584.1 FimV/HubP family polar landmark protein [Variovorax dokdonensis]